MANRSTKHEGDEAAERDIVPTPEESWDRHAQVLDLIGQIRRNRAQLQPGAGLRRPAS